MSTKIKPKFEQNYGKLFLFAILYNEPSEMVYFFTIAFLSPSVPLSLAAVCQRMLNPPYQQR